MRLTPEEVLHEFTRDIEAAGIDTVADDWPDLLMTYKHAKECLWEPLPTEYYKAWGKQD
jgi:hypothetical protein